MKSKIVFSLLVVSLLSIPVFASEPEACEGAAAGKGVSDNVMVAYLGTSKELNLFFKRNPKAGDLLRGALLGKAHQLTAELLATIINNLDPSRRAEIIKLGLEQALNQPFSRYFEEYMLEEGVRSPAVFPRVFELPNYERADLNYMLKVASLVGHRVMVFRGGLRDVAFVQRLGEAAHFFDLNVDGVKAETISAIDFGKVFKWRSRNSAPRLSSENPVTLDFVLGKGGVESKDKLIEDYEKSFSDTEKLKWRYAVNSLSDDGFDVFQYLIRLRHHEYSSVMSMGSDGAGALVSDDTFFYRFANSLWHEARGSGHRVRLTGEWTPHELNAMMESYGKVLDRGVKANFAYRIWFYEGANYNFVASLANPTVGYQLVTNGQLLKLLDQSDAQAKSSPKTQADQ